MILFGDDVRSLNCECEPWASDPPATVPRTPAPSFSPINLIFLMGQALCHTLSNITLEPRKTCKKSALLESERRATNSTPYSSQWWCPLREWGGGSLGQKGKWTVEEEGDKKWKPCRLSPYSSAVLLTCVAARLTQKALFLVVSFCGS